MKNVLLSWCFGVVLFCCGFGLAAQDSTRRINIGKDHVYLNIPVAESNQQVRMKVSHAGKTVDQFTIKLATGKPDYWVFLDVTAYQGKAIQVDLAKTPGRRGANAAVINTVADNAEIKSGNGLEKVFADKVFPGQDSLYKELRRPAVHFSSRRGWLNDPNGLIYYQGEYHLFYQHNPYGWSWGNMHWGHAVSQDLLHWKEWPEAIYPFNEQDAAFSGSAVVDPTNTGGFRKNEIDPLIAFYTSTGRGECIKISYDKGRTFIDYPNNPILVHKGRDPKVFWYDAGKHWVMVVWDEEKKRKLSLDEESVISQHLIYTSPNLKDWTFQSGIEGFFECPDLFELTIDNSTGQSKWVMYDATGRYLVGDFDGKKFSPIQRFRQYDYGGGFFYAAQTYNNVPDNRRIQVGWGRGIAQPGMPFNQAMLFPTELMLKSSFDGIRLCPTPIREITTLHQHSQVLENKVIKPGSPLSVSVNSDAVHVIAEFEKGDAIPFGLNVMGAEILFNDQIGECWLKADSTPIRTSYSIPGDNTFKIEAIVDQNILEVFINNGELYYVVPFNIKKEPKIDALVKGRGDQRKSILKKLQVHELKSIWDQALTR